MFRDISDFEYGTSLDYHICIIGTGPAGLSIAKKLINTNYKVAVLESGGITPETKYQELNRGINTGESFLSLDSSRLRCFGGAGKLWAGRCAPFKEDDFKKKNYIPLSGWPINLNDLQPYYSEASKMLGISHEDFYSNKLRNKTSLEKTFHEFSRPNNFLISNILQSARERDFSSKYFLEFKNSKNLEFIFHSTVTELNVINKGRDVSSINISNIEKHFLKLKSKIFILACGALENPRILLNSNKFHKNGIGNDSRMVGKCFMSHPGIDSIAEIHKTSNKPDQDASNNIGGRHFIFFETSAKQRHKNKILRHSFSLKKSNNITSLDISADTLYNKIKSKILSLNKKTALNKNIWDLSIGLEQNPRLSNSISLDKSKDKLGVPLLKVNWGKVSKLEKNTLINSTKIIARELGSLNVGRVKFQKKLNSNEISKINDPINHHIGTTRMSSSPRDGVVDRNCKVFGISNLYIAGSSVFTTSSIVNPTYTIIALSLRLGDYIKKKLADDKY